MKRTILNRKAPEWPQPQLLALWVQPIISEVIPNASGSNFTDKVKLQEQLSALQLQQNRIIEMLSANQSKSRLPQPRVSTFDGDAAEYRTFIRAFESLIESKTSSSTERLRVLLRTIYLWGRQGICAFMSSFATRSRVPGGSSVVEKEVRR